MSNFSWRQVLRPVRSRTHDDVEARDRLIEADLESSRLQGSGTKIVSFSSILFLAISEALPTNRNAQISRRFVSGKRSICEDSCQLCMCYSYHCEDDIRQIKACIDETKACFEL